LTVLDWLRLLGMVFYAPVRGLREVRDRAPLAPIALMAFVSQILYFAATQWLSGNRNLILRPGAVIGVLFQSALSLLLVGGVLVPIVAFVANIFERRGRFSLLLQQEYATLASTFLYALVIANIVTIPVSLFFNLSGIQASYVAQSAQSAAQVETWFRLPPDVRAQLQIALIWPFEDDEFFAQLQFGLGTFAGPIDVEVRMPGGAVSRWRNQPVDRLLKLELKP